METEKDRQKELAQHFDNIFDTATIRSLDFEKMKILHKVYEYFEEELVKTNPKYKELRKQHIEIVDMLEQSHSKAQKTLFEKHLDIGCDMVSLENEQLFYFGFILAKALDTETKIDISAKK